ncbi:DUF4286 family protein [Pseudomonas amygdali]|uniref:DUF4286 family protein n=2 Tax=Pseudomonas amygdali TaxID=47877 RepID=UPI0006E70190|nr:DUF4286 family protein [Pseudomonas amygdali]KPY58753.1 Uncharacterized protein ALO93_00029 [Pseudomonas amygdali pv. sesami]RMT87718.1 hypothetical protein ALP38_03761 [Pseudomonas amygdali pv. sesami]RMT93987.1 hypothetical protein ALP37_02960 [Pseudomonas amygdali pv. sesami]RMV84030.1 hypothetical protein ALP04_01124 [Pseudomonas amygdali pv. sesami]
MSLAGTGVVAIWHDLLPEARDEFYEWHNREHMPERAAIPGFLRGRRYIALDAGPTYFNLYEADTVQVLGGEDYLSRLNTPTPWTQQSVKSYRNVARSICDVTYSSGVGQGAFLLTVRFDVIEGQHKSVSDALRQSVLPPIADKQGITGVHLCVADEVVSKVETAEKKARSEGTQIPAWIVMIEGCASDYVRAAGESFLAQLHRLLEGQSTGPETTLYQLEYIRCKTPESAG